MRVPLSAMSTRLTWRPFRYWLHLVPSNVSSLRLSAGLLSKDVRRGGSEPPPSVISGGSNPVGRVSASQVSGAMRCALSVGPRTKHVQSDGVAEGYWVAATAARVMT